MYYFDESGFTGVPEIPYAWQDEDEQLLLPSGKTSRINVLGFLNKQNDFFPCVFDCSVTSDIVTACFDAFSRYIVSADFLSYEEDMFVPLLRPSLKIMVKKRLARGSERFLKQFHRILATIHPSRQTAGNQIAEIRV